MRRGLYRSCILASSGIGLLLACSGPAADLGKATGATYEDPCPSDASTIPDSNFGIDANIPDAPWFPDAPDIIDAGPDTSGPFDGSSPDVYIPPPAGDSLIVDGMPCWSIETDGETREWPHWAITVRAYCPSAIGQIYLRLDSYANIPYPQSCSVATTVQMYPSGGGTDAGDGGGWGGASYFEAGYSDGSCSVTSGPTMVSPARRLDYTAVVEDVYGLGLTHFIYFRAGGLP